MKRGHFKKKGCFYGEGGGFKVEKLTGRIRTFVQHYTRN